MLAFNEFDPYALIAKRTRVNAKPAKTAKIDSILPATLAGLATLAGQATQTHHASAIGEITWDATDWQEYFDERAGVTEHDGDIARIDAERQAFEACVVRWMSINLPAQIHSGLCPSCNRPCSPSAAAPVLNPGGGHLWLHRECLEPWWKHRRQEAITHLKSLFSTIKINHEIEQDKK